MNNKIQILSSDLINKIAAGEVIERPSSVVKELIENSIDAGATKIEIEIQEFGKKLIRVTDNGAGMTERRLNLLYKGILQVRSHHQMIFLISKPWASEERLSLPLTVFLILRLNKIQTARD